MHFSNFFPLFFYSASTWHFLPINSLPSFTEPCNRGNTSLRLNSALSAFGCSLMKFKAKCLVILPRGYLSNELMIIDFQFPNKKKTCSLQKKYKKRKTIKKIGEMAQAINPNSDCWECFHGIYHSLIFYTWKLNICIWHLMISSTIVINKQWNERRVLKLIGVLKSTENFFFYLTYIILCQ